MSNANRPEPSTQDNATAQERPSQQVKEDKKNHESQGDNNVAPATRETALPKK
jgi:hypothetical protein